MDRAGQAGKASGHLVTTVDPVDDSPNRRNHVRRKANKLIPRLAEDDYHLPCEWGDCSEVSTQMLTFIQHVSDHITHYFMQAVGSSVSSGMCITCSWRDCGAQILGSLIDFNRHVYFHVFHVRLKCLGAHLARVLNLGTCMLGSQSCNWIPELPENLQCAWDTCTIIFDNPYFFYAHVCHHAEEYPEGRTVVCKCLWKGCKTTVRSKHKLKEHLRSHTQEKQVACPTCGGLFCSHTKLTDHILRQAQSNLQRYECSHCSRRFATERMLREHMRRHVNHYKCPLCDMTCPSPSALRQHVRYRHSEEKPFKCGHCEFSAKSSADLRKHLDSHNVEDQFTCHIARCPFSARSYSSLALHFKKHHQSEDLNSTRYMCHICNKTFGRGYSLTFHLKKKHLFQWPPGHSRFRYKQHADGYLRLQTVRYESMEVSEATPKEGAGSVALSSRKPGWSRKKKCIVTTSVPTPQLPPPAPPSLAQGAAASGGAGAGGGGDSGNASAGVASPEEEEEEGWAVRRKSRCTCAEDAGNVKVGKNPPAPRKKQRRSISQVFGLAPNNEGMAGGRYGGMTGDPATTTTTTTADTTTTTTADDTAAAGSVSGVSPGRTGRGRAVRINSAAPRATRTAAAAAAAAAGRVVVYKTESSGPSSSVGVPAKKAPAGSARGIAPAPVTAPADVPVPDPSPTPTKSSRKRQRKETTPARRRRATVTVTATATATTTTATATATTATATTTATAAATSATARLSLDECPPEMLEMRWPWCAGPGEEEAEPRGGRGKTRAARGAGGGPEDQGGGASPSRQQAIGRERRTTRAGGGAVGAPPHLVTAEGVGLRVAEYGDSAEANLHMLGDVALTSLRVPKGKMPFCRGSAQDR